MRALRGAQCVAAKLGRDDQTEVYYSMPFGREVGTFPAGRWQKRVPHLACGQPCGARSNWLNRRAAPSPCSVSKRWLSRFDRKSDLITFITFGRGVAPIAASSRSASRSPILRHASGCTFRQGLQARRSTIDKVAGKVGQREKVLLIHSRDALRLLLDIRLGQELERQRPR